jgi:inhibitor of cysteine peptidase
MSDEEIEVAVNEVFTITMDSNPTTGYRWEVNYDDNFLELIFRKFNQLSDSIGSGGFEKFEFKGLTLCETNVKMIYKREWEEKSLKTISFRVKVK